jgi:hypothetical protein
MDGDGGGGEMGDGVIGVVSSLSLSLSSALLTGLWLYLQDRKI